MAENTRPDRFRLVNREFGSLRSALERLSLDSGLRRRLLDQGQLEVDVYEDGGKTVVEAALPGFDRDAIDVELRDGVLAIRAARQSTQEEQTRNYYRRERHFGAVSRRIPLPGVRAGAPLEVRFENGVLRVEIEGRAAR